MARVIPRTLSGFMELQPADQMKMERMTDALRDVYSLYGFTPLAHNVHGLLKSLLSRPFHHGQVS